MLEINEDGAKVTGRVHVGNVMVDGLGVGDVGNIVFVTDSVWLRTESSSL